MSYGGICRRRPDEYTNRSANAIVAQALAEAGVHLAPGETVEYIIIDATGKRNPEKAKAVALYSLDDGYDIEKYTEMALKAVETLLFPFGYDAERLREMWCPVPKKIKRAVVKAVRCRESCLIQNSDIRYLNSELEVPGESVQTIPDSESGFGCEVDVDEAD